MSQQQPVSAKKQQGISNWNAFLNFDWNFIDLQVAYTQYKETLQALAQKIGDVEQESEEHK